MIMLIRWMIVCQQDAGKTPKQMQLYEYEVTFNQHSLFLFPNWSKPYQ